MTVFAEFSPHKTIKKIFRKTRTYAGFQLYSILSVYYFRFIITIFHLYHNREMQAKFYQICNRLTSPKALENCSSVPKLSQSTDSSCNSIEACDDQYRKCAIKWILSYNRKITKDTNYLALSYLTKLAGKSIYFNQQNWEKIAVTLLLLASKTNQIYAPKIRSMIAKCKGNINKEDIIDMEAYILNAFDYDIAFDYTPYSLLIKILGQVHSNKLEECEKLFKIVTCYPQIYQFGDQVLAYALIYLIIPQYVREMKLKDNQRVKAIAIKIFQIYNNVKDIYQKKENRGY